LIVVPGLKNINIQNAAVVAIIILVFAFVVRLAFNNTFYTIV